MTLTLGISQTVKIQLSDGFRDSVTVANTNPVYGSHTQFEGSMLSGTYRKTAFVAYYTNVEIFLENSRAIL